MLKNGEQSIIKKLINIKISDIENMINSLKKYSHDEKIRNTILASKICMEFADSCINFFYQTDADIEFLDIALTHYQFSIDLLKEIGKEPSLLLDLSFFKAEAEKDFYDNTRVGFQQKNALQLYQSRKLAGFYTKTDEENTSSDISDDQHELEPLRKCARKDPDLEDPMDAEEHHFHTSSYHF